MGSQVVVMRVALGKRSSNTRSKPVHNTASVWSVRGSSRRQWSSGKHSQSITSRSAGWVGRRRVASHLAGTVPTAPRRTVHAPYSAHGSPVTHAVFDEPRPAGHPHG